MGGFVQKRGLVRKAWLEAVTSEMVGVRKGYAFEMSSDQVWLLPSHSGRV